MVIFVGMVNRTTGVERSVMMAIISMVMAAARHVEMSAVTAD
jgi:hypothetical protein